MIPGLLAGCSGWSQFDSPGPGKTAVRQNTRMGARLYVANLSQHVTVYAPGRESVIGTIARGINQPVSLALDAAGGLFVGNDAHSLIRVYDPTN
jgi:hypothetical protein